MERVKLEVQPRVDVGSRAVRRLRKQHLVPGVLYGHGKAAHPLTVDERVLRDAVSGPAGLHAVMDISFAGQKTSHTAVVKEYQLDGVKRVVTHVDFQEVKLTDPIEAEVTVVFEGDAAGVMVGGVLDVLMREVTIKALPMAIPERLVLDVSALEVGDVGHVRDLVLPEGAEILNDPDEVLCSLMMPRVAVATEEEEEAAAEAAAVAEAAGPEVISEGSDEEAKAE
jgi:large subunit ribosomal protein L25